jgi:flavin-dependent dehydrogenase
VIDLIVAGGGPVGLATAILARQAGLDVTVVEPRKGCIDKACGEGLMPGALAELRALDVDPPGMDLAGIRYLSGSGDAQARFRAGTGRGVRRTVLHGELQERAREMGVRWRSGKVTELTHRRDFVETSGLRARYLIGADGLHSQVRRRAGLEGRARGPRRYGLRQHFQIAPWTDLVEVHWLPDHEVYVTPVGDDTVGIAVLGRNPLDLGATIAQLPRLAALLGAAAPASDLRGAGPFRHSPTGRVAGRVLLVGDASGYVDALTGEGLRVGFAQARAAVGAVVAGRPDRYEREWRQLTRSSRSVTNTLLWVAGRPAIRPLIVPAAQALPGAMGVLVDRIAA